MNVMPSRGTEGARTLSGQGMGEGYGAAMPFEGVTSCRNLVLFFFFALVN